MQSYILLICWPSMQSYMQIGNDYACVGEQQPLAAMLANRKFV